MGRFQEIATRARQTASEHQTRVEAERKSALTQSVEALQSVIFPLIQEAEADLKNQNDIVSAELIPANNKNGSRAVLTIVQKRFPSTHRLTFEILSGERSSKLEWTETGPDFESGGEAIVVDDNLELKISKIVTDFIEQALTGHCEVSEEEAKSFFAGLRNEQEVP